MNGPPLGLDDAWGQPVAGWLEKDGKYAGWYSLSPDGRRCYHFSHVHGLTTEEHEEAAEDIALVDEVAVRTADAAPQDQL